jgi:hypothetical protein
MLHPSSSGSLVSMYCWWSQYVQAFDLDPWNYGTDNKWILKHTISMCKLFGKTKEQMGYFDFESCYIAVIVHPEWNLVFFVGVRVEMMRSRRVRWPIFRWEMVDNSICGWRRRSRPDYNHPRTLRLSNRYTSSDGCRDLAARQPATRAPVLQAIEEPARTRRTST